MVCSKNGGKEWRYKNLVYKPELRRPSGRPTSKGEDNIKLNVY